MSCRISSNINLQLLCRCTSYFTNTEYNTPMKFKLIFFSLFLSISLFGQRAVEADALFNSKQYTKARGIYESLLKQKPNDPKFNFRYAQCCYELKDAEQAILHFEMAGSKFPQREVYLGELYFTTYRFDKSVIAYQNYLATLKPDDIKIQELQSKIAKSEKAARLIAKVEDIAIVDSILVDKTDFLRFYKTSSELGTLNQSLLKLNARRTVDKITYTTQRKDRVYYSDSIHGQMDLFTSYKLFDAWSTPVSVSKIINTSANENYPFLLLDGITLYFASDNENSIGGYDIFVTRYTPSSDSFLAPENVGFPFNSMANDYMMVIDEQRKLGWFATDRNQVAGKVMIYTFVPNDSKTIIRTEDKDYIRLVALLKSYRKSSKTTMENTEITKSDVTEPNKQIEFIVNDSTVYTHLSQFKCSDAMKLWNEKEKIAADLKLSKAKLDALRLRYDSAQTPEERSVIAPGIGELESKNIELELLLRKKIMELRNAENTFLKE
jgi:tetratricopeptide (TPR) repeat protein